MGWANIDERWDKIKYLQNTSQTIVDVLAIAPRQTLYFPAGVYWIENVTLPDDTEIICDKGAILQGVSAQSDMFILEGSRVTVKGGLWTQARSAFSRGDLTSSHSNVFQGMEFNQIETAFELERLYGTKWRDCVFDDVERGIHLLGAINSSINVIDACKFYTSGISVEVENGHKNIIKGSWFEDCANTVIKLGNCDNITIESCWLESNGGVSMPDIVVAGQARQTLIANNRFSHSNIGITERINISGVANINTKNNEVHLRAGEVFVHVEADSSYMSHFIQNNIIAPGEPYVDRLFRRVSNHQIKYDVFVGADTLGADVYIERVIDN